MDTLPQAIARMEGFYAESDTQNRPQRNNNPGDIEYGVLAIGCGACGSDGRFAIFPNSEMGFSCLFHLLSGPDYRMLTIQQAIEKYAPANENDTESYVRNVCAWSECTPDDVVSEVLARETSD